MEWLRDTPEVLALTFSVTVALLAAYQTWRSATNGSLAQKQAEDALSDAIGIAEIPPEGSGAVATEGLREQLDQPMARRIGEVARSLRDSQLLMAELESEMKTRFRMIERLRAEEEESRHLAALKEEEARAVRDLLGRVVDSAHEALRDRLEQERLDLRGRLKEVQQFLESSQRKNRRDQIRFFLYGVAASIPVGIVINIFF